MAEVTTATPTPLNQFRSKVSPDWCPGCGDFGVLNALFQACAEIDVELLYRRASADLEGGATPVIG